jgi:hypothetical protein
VESLRVEINITEIKMKVNVGILKGQEGEEWTQSFERDREGSRGSW